MWSEQRAHDKARAVWGPTIGAPQQAAAAWLFSLPGDPAVHRIDGNGRVACGHPLCIAAERRALMDAPANARVRFQRVIHTRIGLPDRIEVLSPGGVLLASITATENAIEVAGVRGATIEAGPEGAAEGRPRSLRITFHA